MRQLIIAALGFLLLGCTTTSSLPTQYLTLKLIESEHVTAPAVVERVERVRVLMDFKVAISGQELATAIDWDSLAMSDRLLVAALFGDLEVDFESPAPFSDELRAQILQRLDWIEQAARMAQ